MHIGSRPWRRRLVQPALAASHDAHLFGAGVAVCAVRTGSGKSQTTRHIAKLLRDDGKRVAVLRHPMPYGDLTKQAVQRFADYADLDAADATIEEREEYEPHIAEGNVVFAGIDYAAILDEAEQEADVILWDGGNNDTPFIKPNLHVVVVDPPPGHELRYHGRDQPAHGPRLRREQGRHRSARGRRGVLDSIRKVNPEAKVVLAASPFLWRRTARRSPETRARHRGRADARTARWRTEPRSSRPRRNGAAELVDPPVRRRLDREDPGGVPASPSCSRPWATAASRWTS